MPFIVEVQMGPWDVQIGPCDGQIGPKDRCAHPFGLSHLGPWMMHY